jgi:hypothetical protein
MSSLEERKLRDYMLSVSTTYFFENGLILWTDWIRPGSPLHNGIEHVVNRLFPRFASDAIINVAKDKPFFVDFLFCASLLAQ